MHVCMCVCSVVMIVKPADYTGKKQKAEVGHTGRVKGRVGNKKASDLFSFKHHTRAHSAHAIHCVCVCVCLLGSSLMDSKISETITED